MLIEEIDVTAYTYDNLLKAHLSLSTLLHGVTTNGVYSSISTKKPAIDSESLGKDRLVINKAIHIKIEKTDKNTIINTYHKLYKKRIVIHAKALNMLPISNAIDCIFNKKNAHLEYGMCGFRIKDCYCLDLDSDQWEADFIIFKLSDFHELEYTNKEKEWLNQNKTKETKAKFNYLMISDAILSELNKKENDYTFYLSENRYIKCQRPRGWNKLIKDSIEYYMNNVVLKDKGYKVNLPKMNSTHKFCFKDPIFDLGEVKLDLENENSID